MTDVISSGKAFVREATPEELELYYEFMALFDDPDNSHVIKYCDTAFLPANTELNPESYNKLWRFGKVSATLEYGENPDTGRWLSSLAVCVENLPVFSISVSGDKNLEQEHPGATVSLNRGVRWKEEFEMALMEERNLKNQTETPVNLSDYRMPSILEIEKN